MWLSQLSRYTPNNMMICVFVAILTCPQPNKVGVWHRSIRKHYKYHAKPLHYHAILVREIWQLSYLWICHHAIPAKQGMAGSKCSHNQLLPQQPHWSSNNEQFVQPQHPQQLQPQPCHHPMSSTRSQGQQTCSGRRSKAMSLDGVKGGAKKGGARRARRAQRAVRRLRGLVRGPNRAG